MKNILLFISMILFIAGSAFSDNRESEIIDQFDYPGINEIIVTNAGLVHIEVYGEESRSVAGVFSSEYPHDFKIRHEKRGNTLFIRITKRKSRIRWNLRGTILELNVPRTIDLDLETSVGSIVVEEIDGTARIRCSTGIIEVADCNGSFKTSTTAGGQTFFDCSGRISAHCTTGRIYISDFVGSLDLDTTTGNQKGEYIELTGDSRFHTTTGVLRMNLMNSEDDLSFDLGTTVGSIRLNDIRVRERLHSGEGKISVRARTTTGSQSFYTGR